MDINSGGSGGRSSLKQYYGDIDQHLNDSSVCDPFDINSADFNCDLYLNKVKIKLNTLLMIY